MNAGAEEQQNAPFGIVGHAGMSIAPPLGEPGLMKPDPAVRLQREEVRI
jgi:hypothetical protein